MADDLGYDEIISVFYSERYSGDWMPSDLLGAIAWLTAKAAAIPFEYRTNAIIEIDSESGSIEIKYRRPPMPEEIMQRTAARDTARRDEIERLERALKNVREGKYR